MMPTKPSPDLEQIAEGFSATVGDAKPQRLLDVYNEINPAGREVEMNTLDGTEALITGVTFRESGFLMSAEIMFSNEDGEHFHVKTDAGDIVEKLRVVAKRLPLYATFTLTLDADSGAPYWRLI